MDIGFCGLHVVSDVFETGVFNTDEYCLVLSLAWSYFKNFPSRKADYLQSTKSKLFTQKVCPVRWVENISVTERVSLVSLFRCPYLKDLEGGKCKIPATENDQSLCKFAKLEFCITLAAEVESFLKIFQSAETLTALLYNTILCIAKSLHGRVCNEESLTAAHTTAKLIARDIREKIAHFLAAANISL
ncbi:hypothetical protein PR048_001353, partial [Dryococelus australis]